MLIISLILNVMLVVIIASQKKLLVTTGKLLLEGGELMDRAHSIMVKQRDAQLEYQGIKDQFYSDTGES